MRGAVGNTERWEGRCAPTQNPSTNHLLFRTATIREDVLALQQLTGRGAGAVASTALRATGGLLASLLAVNALVLQDAAAGAGSFDPWRSTDAGGGGPVLRP